MDARFAALLLGVAHGASENEIRAAYDLERERRRGNGDRVDRLDEALETLIANLPPSPQRPPPDEPKPAQQPIGLAIIVLLMTVLLLSSGIGQALGVGDGSILVVAEALALPTAFVYHRAWRRAYPSSRPVGGWALGITAAAAAASAAGAGDDPLAVMMLAMLTGFCAMGSAIRVFGRKAEAATRP